MTEAERTTRYVIDASTAIKLFLVDPLSDRAHDLFNLLTTELPVELYVPDLFFIECTHVLWKYVRWGGLNQEVAREDLVDLASLRLQVTSTADLMTASLELAVRHSISAYDACYLALAAHYDAVLITADEKLAQVRPEIIWLGNFHLDAMN
jgi:predicted nucleic acid-binding protein